jgi:hypothetical protein
MLLGKGMLRRVIASLVLLAWLPQLAILWHGPWEMTTEKLRQDFTEAVETTKRFPDDAGMRANREMFQRAADDPGPLLQWVWVGWGQAVALMAFGIAAGFTAWRGFRFWRWLVAASSVTYYLLYSWTSSLDLLYRESRSIDEILARLRVLAKSPLFFHSNFVLPLVLLTVLVLLFLEISRSRRAVATSNPTIERNVK